MVLTKEMTSSREFEQNMPTETEQKFVPLFPEELLGYRREARPIEQYYLSHPSEEFSLRLRETMAPSGELTYTATLKNTGYVVAEGLERMEVEVPINQELYQWYKSPDAPLLRKLRAEPFPGITIDFFDDDTVQLESEHEENWRRFLRVHGDMFCETTGDRSANNEWRAHVDFRRAHGGQEAFKPAPELQVDTIIADILHTRRTRNVVTVHIAGRSGSGKSTIVEQLKDELYYEYGLRSEVVSTDDYHRGTSWLVDYNGGNAWTAWDDAIVYDTKRMGHDLKLIKRGCSVPRRKIDFTIAEPTVDGEINPADVIIIEGIYAASPDVTTDGDLHFEMSTPLATCIGRRLLRDMRERPEFADPTKSLAYILEQAEPAYRAQQLGANA